MKILIFLIPLCGIALGIIIDSEKDISLEIYDHENKESPRWVGKTYDEIEKIFRESGWSNRKPVVLIHGMMNKDEFQKSIIDAYFRDDDKSKDLALIAVDWEMGVIEWIDSDLRKNVESTANYLRYLFYQLQFDDYLNFKELEFIGHGIGAHVAAMASRFLKDKFRTKKITALDPAGHVFQVNENNLEETLRKTDASYVEVYHTNGLFQGHQEPLGDVDIYLNRGEIQPKCSKSNVDFGQCSHVYAFEFYAHHLKHESDGHFCQSLEQLRSDPGSCVNHGKIFGPNQNLAECETLDCLYYVNTKFIHASDANSPRQKRSTKLIRKPRGIFEDCLGSFNADRDIIVEKYTYNAVSELIVQGFKIPDWDSMIQTLNKNYETVIFIHGFQGGSLNKTMVHGFLKDSSSKVNLIGINWLEGAKTLNYRMAKTRVPLVGQYVGKLIIEMIKHINIKNLMLIGHSLGAHCAGNAGKYFGRKKRQIKLPLIYGLDPAGPLFYDDNAVFPKYKYKKRLSEKDAERVIVLHTNAGGFGFLGTLGTADIFLNGGIFQPGCSGWGNYVKQIAGVAGDSSACGPEAAIVEVSAKGGKWLSEKATNVFLLRKGSSLCAHSYAHTYFGDIFNVGRQNYLRGLSCKGSFEDPLDRVLKSNCSDDKAHQQRQFRNAVDISLLNTLSYINNPASDFGLSTIDRLWELGRNFAEEHGLLKNCVRASQSLAFEVKDTVEDGAEELADGACTEAKNWIKEGFNKVKNTIGKVL